jgi:tRNA-binding protein
MSQITFDDWKKLDIRIGKVVDVKRVPKTDKLYSLSVDVGDRTLQTITSLVDFYAEDELLGQKIAVLVNLKPAKFGGVLSEGMILCAEIKGGKCVLLIPEKDMEEGTPVA